ncbi:MAG: hypothetical protein KJ896_02515, partial [Nanoarchaeota archaeon]|nr:hypothetical protein [Nanoarchaeota archaeon]
VLTNDDSVRDVVYVIFDEVHYINDIERGYVWEESIIYSPKEVRFLCLSATIPNAAEFSAWIESIKGHTVKTITSDFRVVPLKHFFYDYELGITTLDKIKQRIKDTEDMPRYERVMGGRKRQRIRVPEPDHVELIKEMGMEKLPCLFFSFSRKDCQEKAKKLSETKLFDKDTRVISFVSQEVKDWPEDIKKLSSTVVLRNALSKGIAFHHAGLLPIVKELVEELFSRGWIKVLYTTETFAVGINMPAKTVCFNSLRKFDGINFRDLNTKEYFQIAGRAGRRGIDEVGYVYSMIFRPAFRYQTIKRLTDKDIEPIKSQFKLSVNTALNILNRHTADEIEHILRQSFFSYQKYGDKWDDVPTQKLLFRYNSIVKKLKKFGFVDENNKLTDKGIFSTNIFVDEMTFGEIFSTGMYKEMTDYQILLILGVLVFEPRERTEFKKIFPTPELAKLKTILRQNPVTGREKKFENLDEVTALLFPLMKGQSFFDLMKNTSLLEGDLIRFFGQVLDRIGQIKKAASDSELELRIDNVKGYVMSALEGIYFV